MTKTEFMHMLIEEGYPFPTEVWRDPGGSVNEHNHPFEVYVLILGGEITLTVDSENITYEPGDIFNLSAEEVHSESYGQEGVRYLVGRRSVDDA